MPTLILDPIESKRLIRERRESGADRFDEVWDGVYVMSPLADVEHQGIAFELAFAIKQIIGTELSARVFTGVNVSDRADKWKRNYRCPDVAVYFPENTAQMRRSHWFGGPDFAVEITSPYDRSRDKLGFYASVGVRELLLVDRKPWKLELYRSADGTMSLVGTSDTETSSALESTVLPAILRLIPGEPRPQIEVSRIDGDARWLV